jgi:endonuclease YncB( thermonuclease family)
MDGGTLDVGRVRVRLQEVAAPEVEHSGQPEPEPGGLEAAAFMARLADSHTLVRELPVEGTLRL